MKCGIFDRRSDFYDWSMDSSSIWKAQVMPMSSWHYTVYNTFTDKIMLYTRTLNTDQ